MTDADLEGASIRLRNWATLDTADPYAIEIFRADILAVLADRERLADRVDERDAENELLNGERADWKQLYEAYCKPDDVRAMEEQRDAANQRADHHAYENRHLSAELAEMREMFKERSDWAQRMWKAWCSARDRARRFAGRVTELEAELAALTEPTEWGTAGVDWGVGFCSDERPIAKRVHSEVQARETIANWAGWYPNDPPPPVLLRREHAAWHAWPLDEDEADEMAAKEEGDA